MRFTTPLTLVLLVLIPAVAALGWPTRGYGRRREIVSLALRLLILLCLILALAGFSFVRSSSDLAVAFLVDVSDSMPQEAVGAAVAYVQSALKAMGPDDQAAVIVFGGEALVERPMSHGRELGSLASIPVTNATDLGEAMRLALALYPQGMARRMVILSDGADTVHHENPAALLETARLAAASGVEINVLSYLVEPGPEILVAGLGTPDHLRQGERFDLRLTLTATRATRANIRVLENDRVVFEGEQDVERGAHSYSLPLTAGEPGFARYQVQITSPDDTFYQNNELEAFSQVEGPPKVLIVAPPEGEPMGFNAETRPDETSALLAALQAAGYVVDMARPEEMPSELAELAQWSAVALVDVPARALSQQQMQALQTYVRDLAGGLVAVGGPTSYGVGGYFLTPLEETLPLEMQIKDEQRRPTLTMVFIIDHSGSMSESSGGAPKLELAKEAAIRSVELLSPMDRVGVIAFDESASWVVPITSLEDPAQVINAIGTIRSGGGTDILAGLQAMAQVLPGEISQVKHVILLTDGGADPAGIPELVSRLYNEHGITLSSVGVGRDAAPFLEQLAELGGGRYHFTADPGSIPSIFTEETTLATRAYIVEEPFYPRLANDSPILSGIDEMPQLYGYVGTSPKEAAQTILVSPKGDPLLAAWQYGLGKALAFTSDATGRWAKDWVRWQGFPRFWAQAVRSTISPRSLSPLEIHVEPRGEAARLSVDAYRYTGDSSIDPNLYLNDYTMQARIVAPDGKVSEVELRQVAPGRYEGDFTPTSQGAYLIRVSGSPADPSRAGDEPVAETAGWVQSYSPEYRQLNSEPDTLARIAAAAGGATAPQDPSRIFTHNLAAPSAPRPAWPWLLALAALLLPFDIAVRRLVIGSADLRRGWEKLASRFARPREAVLRQPTRESRMDTLLQTKERSREEMEARQAEAKVPPAAIPAGEQKPGEKPAASPPAIQEENAEGPEPEEDRASRQSTASTLLEQKRRRQGKEGQ